MNIYINRKTDEIYDTQIVLCLENDDSPKEGNIGKLLSYIRENRGFTGRNKQMELLDFAGQQTPGKYIFIGNGDGVNSEHDSVRKLFSNIAKQLVKLKASEVKLNLEYIEGMDSGKIYLYILSMVESLILSFYKYDKYLSVKNKLSVECINIIVPESMREIAEQACTEAQILAESTCIARDLTNEPSNEQTPQNLAESVRELSVDLAIECDIYDELKMDEWGMKMVLAVGQASPNPPRLIVMRYKGNPQSDEIVGLVGKGITFDSGGLSLKNKSRLPHQKTDMAGSSAVIGAMLDIARRKLPINVTVVVAAVENLLSGKGYKPGDIIGSMAGKSVEIISTDAEGRLTLSDSITYAIKKEKITCLYDISTLTGGARAIFGGYMSPANAHNVQSERTSQ